MLGTAVVCSIVGLETVRAEVLVADNRWVPSLVYAAQFSIQRYAGQAAGQSFVPTGSGPLSSIDVALTTFDTSSANPITVKVYDATAGLAGLSGHLLGSATLPGVINSDPAVLTKLDLTGSGITLTAGTPYIFILSTVPIANRALSSYGNYDLWGSGPNSTTYPSGETINTFNGTNFSTVTGYDLAFAVNVVPEPRTSATPLITGLSIATRRRRTSRGSHDGVNRRPAAQ
jgi:hypothetical protein